MTVATNPVPRYEERSLGVFQVESEELEEEPNLDEKRPRRERISKYFGWHFRRQLSFDIWWLVWGIFLICIIERTKLMDDDNAPWFNIFRLGTNFLWYSITSFSHHGLVTS